MGKRKYSGEFRAEAIRLARSSGLSIRRVAVELGVSNETLGQWLREEAAQGGGTSLGADERAELVSLRRRVRVLETEREILKKAAAFFAQESDRTR